jgi:hypothetical protein
MRFISMCFPTRCKAIICAMSLAVLPVLAACGFEDAFFAEKDPPEKTASAQELSPYWLRDLNHNGVTVAKPRTVSPGLWADRPQVAYSNETLFARPVSRGTSLADAGEAGLVPISALRPGEDPSATLPPPAEEGSPPPAVISASYQSPDLAQSAALVTDQLGPSFADSSQAQVVLPVAAAPQPGRQLHLGFQPVHRVQTAAKAKTVRRAPPAPVIATPVGRDALSSDTTTPAVVADAPETAPPAPPVPRTPVVAAALEDDTDSGAVSGWTAPDSVEEVDVASSASAADSEEALAAPKSPKAKTPTDSYRLQLASLRDRSSASNEGVRLKSRFGELLGDKDLVLESADLGSRGVFHRVQLGPFGSRDHASLTCSDLKALGQDCLVVVR